MTARQQRFVEHYVTSLNATEAAVKAGYRSPAVEGCRLLKHAKVRQLIDEATREKSRRAELDADWVLARLRAKAEDKGVTDSAAVRATELIGKHVGMFQDSLKVELAAHPEFGALMAKLTGVLARFPEAAAAVREALEGE